MQVQYLCHIQHAHFRHIINHNICLPMLYASSRIWTFNVIGTVTWSNLVFKNIVIYLEVNLNYYTIFTTNKWKLKLGSLDIYIYISLTDFYCLELIYLILMNQNLKRMCWKIKWSEGNAWNWEDKGGLPCWNPVIPLCANVGVIVGYLTWGIFDHFLLLSVCPPSLLNILCFIFMSSLEPWILGKEE